MQGGDYTREWIPGDKDYGAIEGCLPDPEFFKHWRREEEGIFSGKRILIFTYLFKKTELNMLYLFRNIHFFPETKNKV